MDSSDDYELIFKIILIGDSGVGKTNILSQYIHHYFDKNFRATVGVEFGTKIITVDKTRIKAQIWDTAGQERYRAITSSYYKGAKGALVVYDITRPETFGNIEKWIDELKNTCDDYVSLVLLGNKLDLEPNRRVTINEAEKKAEKLGAAFAESSAMDYKTVEKAFSILIENIYQDLLEKRKNGQLSEGLLGFEQGDDLKLFLESTKKKESFKCC